MKLADQPDRGLVQKPSRHPDLASEHPAEAFLSFSLRLTPDHSDRSDSAA
jgi:hypothetical protein